ncbi:Lil3 protein [Musa troglodytarum]|uniref:Lil3 protein n=1 Tax=Musa troglodytarum TaxID=320322 RepID=A0A9E7EM36_9LILI|nr:Lil3 protein [Musa troglodytarum]
MRKDNVDGATACIRQLHMEQCSVQQSSQLLNVLPSARRTTPLASIMSPTLVLITLTCAISRKRSLFLTSSSTDSGAGVVSIATTPEVKLEKVEVAIFKGPRWVGEARRRRWLEDNPEASSTKGPVIFDTSIIRWWAWINRFHLPEAETPNGCLLFPFKIDRCDLLAQMENVFSKTLLLLAVAGVLLIREERSNTNDDDDDNRNWMLVESPGKNPIVQIDRPGPNGPTDTIYELY